MRRQLYTPDEDLPTPVASTKSPVNRLINAPPKRYVRSPAKNTVKSKPAKTDPSVNGNKSSSESDDPDEDTFKNKRKSQKRKTCSSAKKAMKPNPEKPGPSVNGHGKKSSSESDDSDVGFHPFKNERKFQKSKTRSSARKAGKANLEKPGPSVNGHEKTSSSESDDFDDDFLPDKSVNNSKRYNARSPAKKAVETDSEKPEQETQIELLFRETSINQKQEPGTSGNGHCSKSPSKSDDSDIEFLPIKNDNKFHKSHKSTLHKSESDFESDASTTKSTMRNRMPYSKAEDEMIIEYIMVRNRLERCNGNTLWVDLAKSKSKNINQRTFHSLRNRFLKNIKPLLLTRFRYLLTEDNIKVILKMFPQLKGKNYSYEKIELRNKSKSKVNAKPAKVPAKVPEKEEVTLLDSDSDSVEEIELGEVIYNPLRNSQLVKTREPEKGKNERSRKLSELFEELRETPELVEKRPKEPERVEKTHKGPGRVEETQKLPRQVEETHKVSGRVEENQEVPRRIEKTQEVSKWVEETQKVPRQVEETQKVPRQVEETRKVSGRVEENQEVPRRIEKTQEVSKRVEETDDESDWITNTPEEIILARQKSQKPMEIPVKEKRASKKSSLEEKLTPKKYSAEENLSPEKSSKEDEKELQKSSDDEETQLCLGNLDVSKFSSQTKETENINIIIHNDTEKNVEHEESQSLCLPSTSSNKKSEQFCMDEHVEASLKEHIEAPLAEKLEASLAEHLEASLGKKKSLGKPLYRCSMKTKMVVNSALWKLDWFANKRKRRRKRGILIMPVPEVVIKEEEDLEDDSKAYLHEIIQSLVQNCEKILSDDDSDIQEYEEYLKKIKSLHVTKSEPVSTSPERNANSSSHSIDVKKNDTDTDTDSDSDSNSVSSIRSTNSDKSPRRKIRKSLQNPNERTGLLGNMINMLKLKDRK